MKNIIFSLIILATVAAITVSCTISSSKSNDEKAADTFIISENHSHDTTTSSVKTSEIPNVGTQKINPFMIQIVKDYLSLKNTLVSGNDKDAADAGKQLLATFKKVDMKTIPEKNHKEYMEIAQNAKENAEHINDNKGNISHQREHFASLSKDIKDLVAMLGTTQKLYLDFCPMYNNNKGAVWISEVKEIKNPYYGSKMLSCGSIKQEY